MEKQRPRTAIVIGAGAGGIATAARLAKAGFDVTVVEKNSFKGGRCSLIHHEGWRFDQGPSLLLLPKLFMETFHDLDTSLEDEGIELLQCPTNYNVWFSDGENFELSTNLAKMKTQIERWEGKDGFDRYLSWLREGHDHYELSVTHVLHKNFTQFIDLCWPRFVWAGIKLHPLHTIWNRTSKYFHTERLRRVFTFATMYMGMSPFDAPSTYSLLQYTELAEGIWYPRGGFYAVLEALVKVSERFGVKYRMNAPVEQVLMHTDGVTARGVKLQSGEVLTADIVVVNADLVYAYSNLLPQTPSSPAVSYGKDLRKRDGSCSSISFYWALKRKVPELQTHNIFLADEYRESFDAIFDRQTLPNEPSFYLNVPSRIDPTAAPEGCDSLIALVPTGHLLESKGFSAQDSAQKEGGLSRTNEDWPALVERARREVLRIASERTGCENIGDLITNEIINDPHTWEAKFNLDKGSILGLSHSFWNVLSFRPKTRAKGFKGVYFVGASTHPGTGVPIVLAGARITSEQILSDLGMAKSIPWHGAKYEGKIQDQGVKQNRHTNKLDVLRPTYDLVKLGALLLLLVFCWFFLFRNSQIFQQRIVLH
ncbi:phytoene desaturase [Microdochium trichocladiopsis]|uniref:Phytoene desaturase n=1 Tax=Microdochium trichocladiopsis TaxID=1682393 RepID=A0A9P8YGA3_9PEZI|nr:phytoene desaturase [Microdochium trichocladiopsis]KAH7037530.1 phytoene desaturase [Microdochium trichocladiopsis]